MGYYTEHFDPESGLTFEEVTFIQDLYALGYTTGDILYYGGTDLTNLGIGTEGQVLKVSAGGIPEWGAGGGGASELSDLSDVGVTTPTNRNALMADGDSWESRALTLADVSDVTASVTEVNYTDGVTSAIQTQLNNKQPLDTQLTSLAGLSYASNSLKVVRVNAGETDFELATLSAGGDVSKVGTPVNNQIGVWTGDGTIEGDADLTFDTTDNTLSTGILNSTTLTASELVGTNADKDLVSLAVATYPSLTELTYAKGVTSAIQTQLNAKQATITGLTASGTELNILDGATLSTTELNYVDGVTSAIQTQLDAKVDEVASTDNAVVRFNGTGGSVQNSTVTIADTGAVEITIPDTSNTTGLTINQNDVTNNPEALRIVTASTDYSIQVESSVATPQGPSMEFYHNSVSPAIGDDLCRMDFFGNNSVGTKNLFASIRGEIWDATDGSEDGRIDFLADVAGTSGIRLSIGQGDNGIGVGDAGTAGVVSSRGNQDLVLRTGQATGGAATGTITITDGANGAINIAPNGTGEAQVSGNKIITDVDTASTSAKGIVELATIEDTSTGTVADLAVTPDGLAGSTFGVRYMQVIVFEWATNTATGDGKYYAHIPPAFNSMILMYVHAEVITAGTTGTTDIQIANVTQALDILSTKLTIDSGETGSDTAATPAVINASNDQVVTNDLLRIDVDAVSTTPAKGLIVTLGFQTP